MDLISLAVWLIILIVVVAVLYWLADRTGVLARLPAPFLYVIYAVIAILALLVLAHFAGVTRVPR